MEVAVFEGSGQFGPKFKVKGGCPTPITVLCVGILDVSVFFHENAQLSFVLPQFMPCDGEMVLQ